MQYFRQRGPMRWFHNPRNIFMVGSGVLIALYFSNLETVPYTGRTHWIPHLKAMERWIAEKRFEDEKVELMWEILPLTHPESVRVSAIAKNIIDVLQRGMKKEHASSDLGYALEHTMVVEENGSETLSALAENKGKVEGRWHREDEILDDKWVERSRKKGQEQVQGSSHLDGLKWEVLVVNDPSPQAFSIFGGKIVIYTGLLGHFRSDAEIATIIALAVGHIVGRHHVEANIRLLWSACTPSFLHKTTRDPTTDSEKIRLLTFPYWMYKEADYIGLQLIASAGYDPRVAPKVYEKLGKLRGKSVYRERAEVLAQDHIMEEALTIYKEVRAGHGVIVC